MTTFNSQVAADNDDGYSYADDQWNDNVCWWNYSDTAELHGGARFNSVTVAQGALIEAGTALQINVDVIANDVTVNIHADDVDDSEVIGGGTALPLRTLTTASVNWVALASTTTAGVFITSPDITTVVQEIIDRGGWASGADLTIIGDDTQSSLQSASRDYSNTDSHPAKITIIYTAGGESSLVSPRLKIGVGV